MQGVWETQVQSLGQEDPLEEEMATHSSNLPYIVRWTVHGVTELDTTEWLSMHACTESLKGIHSSPPPPHTHLKSGGGVRWGESEN